MSSLPTIALESWAAGYFDGEGCVGWYFSPGYKGGFGVVKVTSIDRRSLRRLRAEFGGKLHAETKRPNPRRQAWTWNIWSDEARAFLRRIRPFVILKGQQIDLFLTLSTPWRYGALTELEVRRRHRIAARLKELKWYGRNTPNS